MPVAQPLLSPSVEAMRQPVLEGTTRPLPWRLNQLDRLQGLLAGAESALLEALAQDLGKPPLEAYVEWAGVQEELRHTRRHLKRWMAAQPIRLPLWSWPARAQVRPEPLGCVLIVGPWNYPFQLCLQPLVSALAAGNTAVVKPSELAPHTAHLIARLLQEAFPPSTVQVVQGDGQVAAQLLEHRFDHIFFTGGARVARLIMAAAAPHLTPLTLELEWGRFAAVIQQCDLLLSMTGTAAEQCVGLGKPVLQLEGEGPQFTPGFAEAQRRLLGPGVFCAAADAAPGSESQLNATAILLERLLERLQHDHRWSNELRQLGLERIGSGGGAARMAADIRDCLSSASHA